MVRVVGGGTSPTSSLTIEEHGIVVDLGRVKGEMGTAKRKPIRKGETWFRTIGRDEKIAFLMGRTAV